MAYSNSIALAQKYVPILDGVYKDASKFSILDTANSDVKFINANTVLLPNVKQFLATCCDIVLHPLIRFP